MFEHASVCAQSLRRVYFVTPMDYISVNGISHECVAISFSRAFPDPEIKSGSPAWPGGFFTMEPLGKPIMFRQV